MLWLAFFAVVAGMLRRSEETRGRGARSLLAVQVSEDSLVTEGVLTPDREA